MKRIMLWAWLMGLVAMTAGAQGVAKKLPELKESAYTHWVGTWATAQHMMPLIDGVSVLTVAR